MKTDSIEYKGCTISIHTDQDAENPFEAWDCEPPIATFYGARHGRFGTYGDLLSVYELAGMLPPETWKREERVRFIREHLKCSLREFAERKRDEGLHDVDAFASLLLDQCDVSEPPSSWREAGDYFDLLETLCKLAGIACYNGQSNGYSQGDSTLVFVMATPAWVETVGAPHESLPDQCKNAFNLYSAWAWGDVYGFTCEDNGEPLDGFDSSVWGFYGDNHEKSGLLEAARGAIDRHVADKLEQEKQEAAELEQAFTF